MVGPLAGQSVTMPTSEERPSCVGPRKQGQSTPGRDDFLTVSVGAVVAGGLVIGGSAPRDVGQRTSNMTISDADFATQIRVEGIDQLRCLLFTL